MMSIIKLSNSRHSFLMENGRVNLVGFLQRCDVCVWMMYVFWQRVVILKKKKETKPQKSNKRIENWRTKNVLFVLDKQDITYTFSWRYEPIEWKHHTYILFVFFGSFKRDYTSYYSNPSYIDETCSLLVTYNRNVKTKSRLWTIHMLHEGVESPGSVHVLSAMQKNFFLVFFSVNKKQKKYF